MSALSALGVFTGLAAAHSPAAHTAATDRSALAAQQNAQAAAARFEDDIQRQLDEQAQAAQRASDFFSQQGQDDQVAPQTSAAAASVRSTPNPVRPARTYVAPSIPQAPPVTQSSTS